MLVVSNIIVPDDIILLIISYLSLDDILRFSQSCKHLYNFFNEDDFWKKEMSYSNLVVTKHVKRIAEQFMTKTPSCASIAEWKLYYLIVRRHQRRWLTGSPVPLETQLEVFAKQDERVLIQKMTDDHIAWLVSFSPGQHSLVLVFNRITGETGHCRSKHRVLEDSRISLMLLLEDFLVIIHQVDTHYNVETFSLKTFQSIMNKTQMEDLSLISDLIRGPERDVRTFNNYFAFFKPNIVTIFKVTEATIEFVEFKLPNTNLMFQYPKFWAFSEDFLCLPYQQIPIHRDADGGPNPPRVLCWSLKEGRQYDLKTDLNGESTTSSIFDDTEIVDGECFGFSNRSLFVWNIKAEALTRKISFPTILPFIPFKGLSVRHGFCIFANGIYDVRGRQLATFPREAIGPVKVYTIFNKRLIVFGRKRVRVADLSDLSVTHVRELSFRLLDIPSPLGPTQGSSLGETYFSKQSSTSTVYSFM